jgi:aspartyl-tRNA(Asn)/glutamyl-tRNA(Gln) amidotransferase subunit A
MGMVAADLEKLTIAHAAAAFRSGDLSPVELTEAYLARIEALDPMLNSYVTVTAEAARAAARQAETELARGHDRGPLHGIPLAYKDLVHTSGVRTTSAARICAERVPDADARVVEALTDAGAVSLGKLNMLEFAYGVVHPDFGPALNPWNLDRSSGGSSSGSGVAVAAGLCLAALGTDTGGSIRNPAAWCGVVGHKPTYGLVSRSGVDPLSWTLDHVGPMTRTVDDAALLLEVLAGYDSRDPGSAPGARFSAADLDQVDVSTLRVAVPRELLHEGVDAEVRGPVEKAIQSLAGVVRSVEEISIPNVEDMLAAQLVIMFSEASTIHQPWLRTRATDYAPLTRDRLEAGSVLLAAHYLSAQRVRRSIIDQFTALHQQVDLLVLPSVPVAAMALGDANLRIEGAAVDVFHGLIRVTGPFNVTGAPAVSVPCGWTPDGLPVGLQLAGRPFEDDVVLAAARAYERGNTAELRFPNAARQSVNREPAEGRA